MIEGIIDWAVALAFLLPFAMALGVALDNHAATLDPAGQYYVAAHQKQAP